MTLTEHQQSQLASGRVVVAVPCEPQPEWVENFDTEYSFWLYGGGVFFGNDPMREHLIDNVLGEGLAPHNLDDKIPTPAGDAIVRDVDVIFAERWEWAVTIELENAHA